MTDTSDILIRIEGKAGCITLNRPKALNALTWDMCLAIEKAFDDWRENPDIALILIDASGEKAFCAGGDIVEMYETGTRQDYSYGRRFWRDEYRLNAKIFEYPKPVVSFLQGFTMGGGVGIGCHGTHRIVGESSKIAMPEVGIGLIPDVGGSLMLALAPGRIGEYLGTTAYRMSAADAIHAGFADHFLPEEQWAALKATLIETGNAEAVEKAATEPTMASDLVANQAEIDTHFGGETLRDIYISMEHEPSDFTAKCMSQMKKNAPLSMYCAIELIHRLRPPQSIRQALELEYRFTHRAMEDGDFIEGIRAMVIDKDKSPNWLFSDAPVVPMPAVISMLLPLGDDALTFEEDTP